MIFSSTDWKQLYPETEYQTKSDRVKGHLFHFLLAHNQSDEGLVNQISGVKVAQKLVAQDAKIYNLTPLIMAAMRKREAVIDKLLTCPIVILNINAADQYGWTALHHASLTSQTIFQKLLNAGAREDCLTNLRASCKDIKALTDFAVEPHSMQKVLFNGNPLTQEDLKVFRMQKYRDLPYFSPAHLKNLWQEDDTIPDNFLHACLLNDWKEKTPNVIIAPFQNGGYQLLAGETIPCGKIIGEYGGVFKENVSSFKKFTSLFESQTKSDKMYLFDSIDATEVGSALRFINCDFPNVVSGECLNKGVRKKFYIALQEIKTGEPLLINYGASSYEITYGPQVLLRRKEMRLFFQPGPLKLMEEDLKLKDLLKRDVKKASLIDYPLSVERLRMLTQITFPLSNPLALIDLHFSGTVDVKVWIALMDEDHSIIKLWNEKHQSPSIYLRMMMMRLEKVESNIKRCHADDYPLFQKWVLDNIETLTLMDLMKAMEKIEEELSKGNRKFENCLKEWLKSYDWTRDETHVFSYTARREVVNNGVNAAAINTMSDKISFVEAKRKVIQNLRKENAGLPGFEGSEFQQMLNEILLNN